MNQGAGGMLLTVPQAIQLVGLAPSLFIVCFLLSLSRRNPQTLVAIFYFLALACSFAFPLRQLYAPLARSQWLQAALMLGESSLPAFSFLLICQFLRGQIPSWRYWLVLAVPLIGGSSLIYASMLEHGAVCQLAEICEDPAALARLYQIFGTALVFLLLVVYSSRLGELHSADPVRRQKYWLIVSLILVQVLAMAVDLAGLAGFTSQGQAQFVISILHLTFIYLVLTSLFRVFYPQLGQQEVSLHTPPATDPETDKKHAAVIAALMEEQHLYREMRLNRAALAKAAGVGENTLSRVVNRHFGKSVSEYINSYRVEDAKRRLRAEKTPVTTIGFEVGFNSTPSFNRVFRDMTGMSPSQWRANGSESA